MTTLRLLNCVLLLACLFDLSCKQTAIDFPQPAPYIEGVYKASAFFASDTLNYPIQGQTMTLKLTSVSRDSVRVEIEATSNGDYSPGGNRTYSRVAVYEILNSSYVNNRQQVCVSYKLLLPHASSIITPDEYLEASCGINGAIDYTFTSPTNQRRAVARFVKM